MRAARRGLGGIAGALLLACAPAPSGEPVVRTVEALRSASEQLPVGGAALTLEVEAWRSFQPVVGEAGDALIAVLRLSAGAGGRIPGALTVAGGYLLHGDEMVAVEPREEEPRAPNATSIAYVVRDGPRWPIGDSIDVVLDIGGLDGPRALLRAPRVAIARVD
jgi:hypothetical protein